ncbi:MAG: Uma2 family endonuclease [Anaerolinea sp.]|nr:Uma2 family endonuclease [Anaerolinea sp.]
MTTVSASIVPLESGDRLSQPEFHRRYEAMPSVKRAELIEGVVYLPSPTRYTYHDAQAAIIRGWAALYVSRHPGLLVGNDATVILDSENEVQPDAFIFRADGGLREDADGYLGGAPELVIEVAGSSDSRDLHQKKDAYERNGIREYVVWRVFNNSIDWFVLRAGRYELKTPPENGVIESEQFPGLRLNVPAALALDLAGVLKGLD